MWQRWVGIMYWYSKACPQFKRSSLPAAQLPRKCLVLLSSVVHAADELGDFCRQVFTAASALELETATVHGDERRLIAAKVNRSAKVPPDDIAAGDVGGTEGCIEKLRISFCRVQNARFFRQPHIRSLADCGEDAII